MLKKLFETGESTNNYYQSINNTYVNVFNKYLMLHYPFFMEEDESLEKRQLNLTNHCLSKVGSIQDKTVLEVGCGNGTQCIYMYNNFLPGKTIGVDINQNNIELAKHLKNGHEKLEFHVDDAQKLDKIPDNSIDILFCIESAFHYPHKQSFFEQVERVLKPSGEFLIADILSKTHKKRIPLLEKWKRKMSFYHWTEHQYAISLQQTDLSVINRENITPQVIEGYKDSRNWIQRRQLNSYFKYLMLKLFVFIQVKINVILLNNRRKYIIFYGVKN
ncbi:MAG: class I SAM-dependent methyltransferase [Bacteroidales bacterium]|nr:class I SAM-dependent methyltransferase [Bacteroidales bacterium]MBS3775291.1 class I SAM-dependent methyltransferase [Bacteroidales bacterium]